MANMVATRRTQSLTDFRQKATETLDRLNITGEAEILTVNGEARAVLLSPAAFDALANEAQLSHDAKVIKQAVREIAEGKGQESGEFFDSLHAELLAIKAEQSQKKV